MEREPAQPDERRQPEIDARHAHASPLPTTPLPQPLLAENRHDRDHLPEIRRSSANHQVLILPDQIGKSDRLGVGTMIAPPPTGDTDMIDRMLAAAAAPALAAVTAVTAAPALAVSPEASARTVSYADLNLATPAGVAALHHRIAAAVETVCGSYNGVVTLAETVEIDKCRAAAQSAADQRVAVIISGSTQVASAR
jgi:UrcA family protein